MRLPESTPPAPTECDYDVVISQLVGLPTTGSSVRTKPTGGSEWQVIVLAEALAARGLRVAIIGPFFAFARDRGVQYIPAGEPEGRRDGYGKHRPTVEITTKVLVSERFGPLPPNVEFDRLVVDLHDIPDARLGGVVAALQDVQDGQVVVHSKFAASLLDGFPNVRVIPCMLPDEFYTAAVNDHEAALPIHPKKTPHYVYASAAMKGLEATLRLWRELKAKRVYHFNRATLHVLSPGYDQIRPEWLDGLRDVRVHAGLSPAATQAFLASSDGVFHVATYAETFGIVFHQAEISGVPVRVLQLHGNRDALWETLVNDDLIYRDADAFVRSFERTNWLPRAVQADYSVSTILPRWLGVLGIGQSEGTPEDRSTDPAREGPRSCASGVPSDGSTTQESAA